MNKKIILFLLVTIVGIIFFVWFYFSLKCSHFLGFQYYGGGGNSGKCVNAGCSIVKIKEVNNPKLIDDEGYFYMCIPN